jgi:hypothetical protein
MVRKKLTKQQRYYRKHKAKYRKYGRNYVKRVKEKAKEKLLNEAKEEKEARKKELSLKKKKIAERKRNKRKYLRRKKALYFIATIRNNKPFRIFNRYVDYSWASKKWDTVLEEQKNLFYPGLKYPLMFLYKVEPGEENTITQRNSIGKIIETKIPGYKIIFQDTFYNEIKIYFKNKSVRVPAYFLIQLLDMNTNIKQVFLIKNKICVEDEGKYFLFTCNDKNEASSIKNRLREKYMETGKTNVLFFNDVNMISMKEEIYDNIVKQGICDLNYLNRGDN